MSKVESTVPHGLLLKQVGAQLAAMGTATDQLLLMRWRIISLCQFLVAGADGEAHELSVGALELFIREGPCPQTETALADARSAIAHGKTDLAGSLLPKITPAKRDEVSDRLNAYDALGVQGIERAISLAPLVRERLQSSAMSVLLAGIRHRFELVATLVADGSRPPCRRRRAAAAILYLDELHDAIPDTLGHVGLLDDDFALRLVLKEDDEYSEAETLHWAERITALWDDLPFLQGVRLRDETGSVATSWLDRVNSYVSFHHAFDGAEKPLVLLQPSVACSPLHSIVSLIGLLVLEGLTSSSNLLDSLVPGHVYEIDGHFYAQYEGTFRGLPVPGWLRLKFRDGTICRPPTMADRMVAVTRRRLSTTKAFTAQRPFGDAEPLQKFFDWHDAIGAASLTSRVLLVTSQRRATALFGGISSNGVSLINDGIVRFTGTDPNPDITRSGLVLVIPTLAVARRLLDEGTRAHAIVVDGYDRLYRGRHVLPFLLAQKTPPPIITWSPTGYYPHSPRDWTPQGRRLQVTASDLSHILKLDGDLAGDVAPERSSLRRAATPNRFERVHVSWTNHEEAILALVDELVEVVRSSRDLPDYWRYQLLSSAMTLRMLVVATPACWHDIQENAKNWKSRFQRQRGGMRPLAAEHLHPIAEALDAVVAKITGVSAKRNSKGDGLLEFLNSSDVADWHIVCDRPQQIKAATRFLRQYSVQNVATVLLRDIGVFEDCIVVGWRNVSFARRLVAHTPRQLVCLVAENEAKRWAQVYGQSDSCGDSILGAIGHIPSSADDFSRPAATLPEDEDIRYLLDDQVESVTDRCVPCMFIWLTGEQEGKVLARDSRVVVEAGEHAREKQAHRIVPEDRVILGAGAGRWSPADEFTHAVVEAIESSRPDLVRSAREWRRALKALQEERAWSARELMHRLADVGVQRGLQTIERWLCLDFASPIGPQHLSEELGAMWPLLDDFTERAANDVVEACGQLRSLHSVAGRALLKLWKGHTVELGIDDAKLGDLVNRIREDVQVHEVDAVDFGEVPEAMIGWWVVPDLVGRYMLKQPSDEDRSRHSEEID